MIRHPVKYSKDMKSRSSSKEEEEEEEAESSF
jgi:hypothetical protein